MSLPVTIIGGYLGAGKTTLVNHMLRHAGGLRLAILVNEFGSLEIDEDLIEAQDSDLISIAGGCICCSFGDNLIGALMDLAKLDPRPDHIVIEASGVALPAAIAANLTLVQGMRVAGVVVLLDAETIRDLAADKYVGDTVLRQMRDADVMVLNKVDLIGDEGVRSLEDWVTAQAGQGPIIPADHGNVPNELLLGTFSPAPEPLDTGHLDDLFETIVVAPDTTKPASEIARLLTEQDLGIVRAKGCVRRDDVSAQVIQIVGKRWAVDAAPEDMAAGIVCIGYAGRLDTDGIRALLIDD